ncbi:MAG: hypothetical protein Q4C47_07290, partial [Planctomycetia bacterium]|nr:hypothetical protein [Planctomycetia bacterium]
TGGGRGMFRCETVEDADRNQEILTDLAHGRGLDLRIGRDEDPSEAATHADDLYPFLPDLPPGEPCAASGFWPVDPESKRDPDWPEMPSYLREVHPVIRKRIRVVRESQRNVEERQEI